MNQLFEAAQNNETAHEKLEQHHKDKAAVKHILHHCGRSPYEVSTL